MAALDRSGTPQLPAELEAELDAIRADPGESVGFGEKAFLPYEPNIAQWLMTSDEPAVTERLQSEVSGQGSRVYRLAVLHVLGRRSDPAVDAALIAALDDSELRATSAYLLGRAGFKGYPSRPRDARAVCAALWPHLPDDGTFEDPFYRRGFRTQDFVLAAFIRVAGPERFQFKDSHLTDLIGYALPSFDDATRTDLLDQTRAFL